MIKFLLSILVFLLCLSAPHHAAASDAPLSAVAQNYAHQVAQKCPKQWEKQKCLKTLSSSALTMATLYGEALKSAKKPKGAEYLKQHCAAATAGTKEDNIPAYAFKSAFTECANAIDEINKQLNIAPDKSLYQLLIIGTICLSSDNQETCNAFETKLLELK